MVESDGILAENDRDIALVKQSYGKPVDARKRPGLGRSNKLSIYVAI